MAGSDHPYKGLPDENFWRRAVFGKHKHEFDPVTDVRFCISRQDKVATAGSCFAQHMARALVRAGFNYLVTEKGEELSAEERKRQQYGVFSARYGNIYTVRQLLNLIDEAFEGRIPAERVWHREDGKFVDPYRPRINPDGFASEDEVIQSRETMLEAFRRLVVEADFFVFTLGLTEGWQSRMDGSVFPLAPGVAGGSYDPARHGFVNFRINEVMEDLENALQKLRSINHRLRVLLTVSPVALAATHERKHVAVATTYSKSVLRVAAEEAFLRHPWVDYFPSYEIITANITQGTYFDDGLRDANAAGVQHVMRVFMQHYTVDQRGRERSGDPVLAVSDEEIVCDENAIEAAARG